MDYEDGVIPDDEVRRAVRELRECFYGWGGSWALGKARSAALHALGWPWRAGADPDELLRAAGLGHVVENPGESPKHWSLRTRRWRRGT